MHPLIERYASAEMAEVFSPVRQALIWRDLWIALAVAQRDLGVGIPEGAVEAMRSGRESIDLDRVAELESELRHDVVAHVHHFGEVAPPGRPYIHLGATSCYVTDNAGLIQIREGLRLVRNRLLAAIAALAAFADRWKELPTLGYTHWQPAQPTTVGKRASVWLQDLVLDLEQVSSLLAGLRFRGARGVTGTEASFVDLFGGDQGRVDALNERLSEEFGFPGIYDVVGQTYPRKVDHRVMSVLAGIGASVARFGQDVRLLQSFGEIEEPFGQRQVGSSAQPYKRNPIRAERISADAVLLLTANVGSGLVVHEPVIRARLERALPFLVVEQILIAVVGRGGDRQDAHELVRRHAMAARARLDEGAEDNDFFERVSADERIGLSAHELRELADPASLVGRAPVQVERFLSRRVAPLLEGASGDELESLEPRV